jgi:multiple sugar transport system ATP-binding protein
LRDGVLQQVDTPRNLYDQPCNEFVAAFIGSPSMNLRPVTLTAEGAVLGGITVPLPRHVLDGATGSTTATLGLRPEAFVISPDGTGLELQVKLVEELGADAYVYSSLPGDDVDAKPLVVRVGGRDTPRLGETIHVNILPGQAHVFDSRTGMRLG